MSLRSRSYILEASEPQWVVRVNDKKVQWSPTVYERIFGKGKRFALVRAPSEREAIRKFAGEKRLNSFYLQAEPKKEPEKR